MTTPKAKSSSPAPAPHKVQRRDASGHLDPQYAKELLEKSGRSSNSDNDDRAFLATSRAGEELAEELGENFVASATSGEETLAEERDAVKEAERGGPYVVTEGQEFAEGTDESNPASATREPFPTT